MSGELIEDRVEFVVRTALMLGVLALGVALGAALGLAELQSSCIASGGLPAPGVTVLPGQLEDNACLEGARRMQTVANTAGGVGAVLLIGGGVVERFEDRVREVIA